ncbi:PAS domain S-box-containing protein [Salegentibacter holothuriorum]|uniref:histidine kinase n=1 Tax=Salegentibacter holothuriorum TaxID=241145 RepID=A0A1T5C7L6_9FLAO|nr:PAS domain S-box protein [Salegentibacter holothuriorum]SKB55405.1 PAS domain S-box-containing protein [Salegentibacter holothuriorum]
MSNKIKILHVEDEPSDALLISHFLQKRKVECEIVVADSRERFLEALNDFGPDIILADHSLPSFNSFEALELLQNLEKPIPVILVTATMTDEFAVSIIKKGAKDYILKDRLERLPTAIESVLKTNRLELERQDFLRKLERSERKFRRLIENSAHAVAILSSKGVPQYVSPSVKNVLGYSEKESLQMDIPEIIHEDYREGFFQKIEECKEKPEKLFYGILVKVKHKKGEWHWLESTLINLLHDPDIKGIVVDFRDVTDRKIAEKALLESEEKYRAFFENSHDGILLTVTDGRILAANAAACKMFQRTELEICEVGRLGLVDPTDPMVLQAIRERQKNGKVLCQINMLRKDGSIFPAALSSSVFHSSSGEKLTSMIIRDSSEAKRAEEELKISEERYRQLFENSPLPNIIYDVNTLELVDINQSATKHYGYNREEFLKLKISEFLPKEDIQVFESLREAANNDDGLIRQSTVRHIRKDNSLITVETYGYKLKYKGRDCRLEICLDVTEKNNHLERLRDKTEKLIYAEKLAKLGYWEVGIQEPYYFWSDEVYRIWGRKKEDFQMDIETFEKTIHPKDLKKFRQDQIKAIKGTRELDNELRIFLPNGKMKWVHGKGKTIRDHRGRPLRFEGSVQDITERKNFLEKLMRSEARQRGILQSQTNYLTRIDLNGYYTYSNEKFLKDFAWVFPSGQIAGEYSLSTVHEYHREMARKVFDNCVNDPATVQQIELDKLQKDGTVKSTLWDFICLTDSKGEPLEVQGVGIDITERVKAEKALKESNQRYELVSKATSDAIYDWDCETGQITWSEGYTKIFGYPTEELTSDIDSWCANIHPEDKLVLEDLFAIIEGKSDTWEAEYRYRRADNKYAFVIEKGTILRDKKGKAIRMLGAIHDITHRKLAMQKLMRSEARHRGLIQSQTNYVIRVDMEGNYTYSNNKFQEDFGEIYPDKNIVGKNTLLSIKEYHHQRVIDISKKCIENPDRVFQVEIDKPAKNGKVKTTLWDFIYLKASPDDPGEIQCVGIDITARVEAEKEIRFHANLLDKIGQAVIATDSDGNINYWNKAATTIYGWQPEEMKGKNILEQTLLGVKTLHALEIIGGLKCDETWSGELLVKRKGDIEFPALVTGAPICDDEFNLKGFIAVSSDNTERKKANLKLKELNKNLRDYTQELVTANKGLEQFSFIVSHNLRSPVANIIGLGDLLKQESYPAEVKLKFQEELLDNVKRLDNVVQDLNAILQVKVELNPKRDLVLLDKLVKTIEGGISNIMQEHEVQITTDFDEVPEIETVQTYLHSIFYNLITNSIKYRHPERKPKLHIQSRRRNNNIILTFKDNGLGFDTSKGEQVFALYKRFHRHIEGKGMALFMVKTQVELLDGKISAYSEVEKGSEFKVEFKEKLNEDLEHEKIAAIYSS